MRALPFGGFVAMAGEENQEDNEEMQDIPIERTLKGIKAYQKVIIFLCRCIYEFHIGYCCAFVCECFCWTVTCECCSSRNNKSRICC
ncbi:MAG: hypothetical protein ACLSBH_22355 [Coprobacillus cateniformis]